MSTLTTRVQSRSVEFSTLTTSWREVGDGDTIDEQVLAAYDELLDEIERSGKRPCISVGADDLPEDVAQAGGWRRRETAGRYSSYVGVLASRFGHRVDRWISLNAPLATLDQHFRPVGGSLADAADAGMLDAAHHLLLAHGCTSKVIRAHAPWGEVGIDLDFELAVPPLNPNRTIDGGWTHEWFPQAIAAGTYPEAVVNAFGWDKAVVLPGDETIISRPIDFVALHSGSSGGAMVDRLATEHGFERFWVTSDH